MDTLPLLSVVVPVYNVEKYLNRCIKSIINQTYRNLEIILVDDGSTDLSSNICDEWKKRDTRIIVIHKKNQGLVSARKAGVRIATGAYITQVDSDDWIEHQTYEVMMSHLIKNSVDVVICGLVKDYVNHSVVDTNTIPVGCYCDRSYLKDILGTLIKKDSFFKHGLSGRIVDKICKTEIAKIAQIKVSNNITMNEDMAMMLRVLCMAKSIVVLEDVFYHYCIRDTSVCDMARDDIRCEKDYRQHLLGIAKEFPFVPDINEQMILAMAYNKAFTNTKSFIKIMGDELYPYRDVNIEQKILIYGAGKFGRRVYDVLNYKKLSIVGWTDKVLRDGCIEIEEALQLDYDVVIIAIAMADLADNAIEDLIKRGVERDRIKKISVDWILDIEN